MTNAVVAQPTRDFLQGQFAAIVEILPWAPLGWWMAWRAGWLALAYACHRSWPLALTALAPNDGEQGNIDQGDARYLRSEN